MDRITFRPVGTPPALVCWHCRSTIDRTRGDVTARYLHPSDQPDTAVIEEWVSCSCGAFQNSRQLAEVVIHPAATVQRRR